jgi:hypothetical protein
MNALRLYSGRAYITVITRWMKRMFKPVFFQPTTPLTGSPVPLQRFTERPVAVTFLLIDDFLLKKPLIITSAF